MPDPMANRIAELQKMSTAQLREQWRRVMGGEPRSYNRAWLYKRLAWAIQARQFGGLSALAGARLEELQSLAEAWMPLGKRGLPAPPEAPPPPPGPAPGTLLTRVYKGTPVAVLVRDDGRFEYDGDLYDSLTAVARAITGSHWNGNHFFFGPKSKRRPA